MKNIRLRLGAHPVKSTVVSVPNLSIKPRLRRLLCILALCGWPAWLGCSSEEPAPKPPLPVPSDKWQVAVETPAAALFSVHGTSNEDVWMVGADDGSGPLVLRFDGIEWNRLETGVRGDLWWVRAFDDGTVYLAGTDSLILRYRDGTFERMKTPGLGKTTIFGLWGASSTDVYAVGSHAGRNGFVWHCDGNAWQDLPLPDDHLLSPENDRPSLTKVWGSSADDVWVVGDRGAIFRGNKVEGFQPVESGADALLFTVHGNGSGDRVVVVGSGGQGVALEAADEVSDQSPEAAPILQGLWVEPNGTAHASGGFGNVYRSEMGQPWSKVEHGLDLSIQSLHAVWVDPQGGFWAVGGNVLTSLDAGVAIHNREIPSLTISVPGTTQAFCPEDAVDLAPGFSMARQWNEQLLNAIRRDTPRPTVHARNLFHTSAAMWDAWVAYQDKASAFLVSESHTADDVGAARAEAISYAAYRILSQRYVQAVGGETTLACLRKFMEHLGYDPFDYTNTGDTPRALGNRIGEAYVAAYTDDGANEKNDYADPTGFAPDEPKLTVDNPGTPSEDYLEWQQIILAEAVTQNGIPEGSGTRDYIGGHWGAVTPFAMTRPGPEQPYYAGKEPPLELNQSLVDAVMQVLRQTAWLDVDDDTMIDISPASIGNNTLGTNDGQGYALNPITNEPYQSVVVSRSDFGRVLAEYWADGPDSETPPGHWNTIANLATNDPDSELRLYGEGEPIDALAWDVHLYFALNGAMHDAAIAAWELKRYYTTSRPITLIRALGTLGQRSFPDKPSYHPDGLPLEDGLVELITEESTKPGQPHAHLKRYVGEIAVYSWRGEPGDRELDVGGHDWIRAKDWIPYQRRTFVTPAFPGYISGHSTFSRAGAVVLSQFTGSEYFPGGSSEVTFSTDYLHFEAGPSEPVTLRWATYADASDQAGQSRLWGGIHVIQDDVDGRLIGAEVGADALDKARGYYDGSSQPGDANP